MEGTQWCSSTTNAEHNLCMHKLHNSQEPPPTTTTRRKDTKMKPLHHRPDTEQILFNIYLLRHQILTSLLSSHWRVWIITLAAVFSLWCVGRKEHAKINKKRICLCQFFSHKESILHVWFMSFFPSKFNPLLQTSKQLCCTE